MQKHYILHLDEIVFSHSDSKDLIYGIAGVAIDKINLQTVEAELNELKREIWNNLPAQAADKIILHAAEIKREPFKNQNYKIFSRRRKRKDAFIGISNIIKNNNMTIFGSAVNLTNLEKTYKLKSNNYIGDGICLEIILNNFTCFLKHHKATGEIIFESRSNKTSNQSDLILQKLFYKHISQGTNIYKALEIQSVLTNISFIRKKDNNAGLQIADFVPKPFIRNLLKEEPEKPNIYKVLRKYRYSGGTTLGEKHSNKFGFVYIDSPLY